VPVYANVPSARAEALRQSLANAQGKIAATGAAPLGLELGVAAAAANLAARGIVTAEKLGYLFRQASGRAHHIERALQNLSQFRRVGIPNNAVGRALVQSHLEAAAQSTSNIVRTFTNQYGTFQVRQSLLAAPGGFLQLESTWQVVSNGVSRLVTVIPLGGP
jgi:hypothetical protein